MDFQERLSAVIDQGLVEIDSERQADNEFGQRWTAVRAVVYRALAEAKSPIQQKNLGAPHVEQENGCTTLFVGRRDYSKGEREFKLSFCADRESRKIKCRANRELLVEETFTLDALTREAIEEKVIEFVKAILALLKSERSR